MSNTPPADAPRALFLDPFHAGAHAAFARRVTSAVPLDWTLLTLPGRHWKWRMRGSALWFADQLAGRPPFDVALVTSYVPLAELRALAPALAATPVALYFHENQLAYPVRDEHTGARDHHFGFTQILSAHAADAVWFNSAWNRDSFLDEAATLLSRMPDAVPAGVVDAIAEKSAVYPVPVALPSEVAPPEPTDSRGPLILWNHRWEYDKAPEAFFSALEQLAERGAPFRLAVCGQRFRKAPSCFEEAERQFADRIVHWGYAERDAYRALLQRADISVSTAVHEFFGVAAIEAAASGAYALVPDRLAYPEWFPPEHRYARGAFVDRLSALVARYNGGEALRADRRAHFEGARAETACAAIDDGLQRLWSQRAGA